MTCIFIIENDKMLVPSICKGIHEPIGSSILDVEERKDLEQG